MPATLTYPGVYIEEIPSGVRTIVGVATSITAFIGYTSRGPLDRAVRIHNFGDFEREFGGLYKDSLVSYAVQQFFLNGGSDAYVVRVAKNAKPATVTMKDISETEVLKVSAASHGVWANDVRMDIDYATSNPDSTFNLTVTRYETKNGRAVPVETERHINLSMNSKSATYAVDVVNATSKLIRLERPDVLSFSERGWSLSGDLSDFDYSDLAEGDTISGVLNGTDPFTLTLPSVSHIYDDKLRNLVEALDSAIEVAELSTYLSASRAYADGTIPLDDSGNFVMLTSQQVPDVDATTEERSSVRITNAPAKLFLGLNNGGREKEGASERRPAPTGTISRDLSNYLDQETNVDGNLEIEIMDNGPIPSAEILSPTTINISSSTKVGYDLCQETQKQIRNIDNPATKNATVQVQGPILRIQSSAETPNASIKLTGRLNIIDEEEEGETLDLNNTGGYVNIQQYRLGTGATFGAQSDAGAGFDGTPPGGSDIIGFFESKTGIYALRDVDLFNLMVIPETTKLDTPQEANSVIQNAIAFCEDQRAFFIIDPPELDGTRISVWAEVSTSRNAALFFPQIKIADPLSEFRLVDKPPSGAVAGVFARTDSQRGVWKAPAGTDAVVKGAQGLRTLLTDLENGPLNQAGVNCLRKFPVYGIISWGARTRRGADSIADEYKYIPVRRLALYIEESLYRGL
ncbi:MAG TPA: phage tail sheath subtilisin-like domain-containing protein, partial [Bacteroidaceae bacterium]|nr:phage tail sheath subtilisin-like domain-containing protein [Bacteroidaceae bacterium]